ncbi:MAG TPA: VTT domain-containing protein [Opitutaceae bacterium]|nr:VTT domain-containing protein [Opitutaceae bacterium]
MRPAAAPRKGLLLKLAVVGVLALAAVAVGAYAWGGKVLLAAAKVWVVRGVAVIGDAGPWAFFSAMAILPAFGCPLLVFALPAGPVFVDRLGLAGVLAAYGAAAAVNMALTYWIARWALRPWIERLMARFGYRIPQIARDEQLEITLLLRITPGAPFFVQSYLLGLGNVAFGTYLWVSWIVVMIYAVGFVVFGDAIMHGKAGTAATGVSLFIAAVIVTHLVRKHLGRRRPAPPA